MFERCRTQIRASTWPTARPRRSDGRGFRRPKLARVWASAVTSWRLSSAASRWSFRVPQPSVSGSSCSNSGPRSRTSAARASSASKSERSTRPARSRSRRERDASRSASSRVLSLAPISQLSNIVLRRRFIPAPTLVRVSRLGEKLPDSRRRTVSTATPHLSASLSWVSPRAFRSERM